MSNRRGQLTIFVIIGLLIVVGIAVYLLWISPSIGISRGGGLYFDRCVSDAITGAATKLEKNVGIPDSSYMYLYNGDRIPYICYTNNFYETCTVQQPFLKQRLEKSISDAVEEEVQNCYQESVSELRDPGFEVSTGEILYKTSLEPGVIKVPIEAPTTIGSQTVTNLNVEVASPLYEMSMIATSILQQESRFGDANVDDLNFYYPEYAVLKFKRGDGTTIYTIRHKTLGNEMRFASRSLAWPAGFGK